LNFLAPQSGFLVVVVVGGLGSRHKHFLQYNLFFFQLATAIATIPIARLSVVIVVTVAVTLPLFRTTIGSFGRGRRWWHVIRVQTIARFAVFFADLTAAAVPTVPIATFHVVIVVALAVSLEFLGAASGSRCRRCGWRVGVQT